MADTIIAATGSITARALYHDFVYGSNYSKNSVHDFFSSWLSVGDIAPIWGYFISTGTGAVFDLAYVHNSSSGVMDVYGTIHGDSSNALPLFSGVNENFDQAFTGFWHCRI